MQINVVNNRGEQIEQSEMDESEGPYNAANEMAKLMT